MICEYAIPLDPFAKCIIFVELLQSNPNAPDMYSNATKMWKTGDCVVFLQSTTNLKSLHEFGFSTLI